MRMAMFVNHIERYVGKGLPVDMDYYLEIFFRTIKTLSKNGVI